MAAVFAVASSGCLLFTDPINMPPTIDGILATPAELFHAQTVIFQVNVSDPNGDAVTLDWARVVGPCAAAMTPAPAAAERSRGPTLLVAETDTKTQFCVWVFATDSHGATAVKKLEMNPLNHTPVAAISVVNPTPGPLGYPLYSTLEFSGEGSTDADPSDDPNLTYKWTLVGKPAGSSVASVVPCPMDTDPKFTCLIPDKAGDYQVQLVVNDGLDLAAPVMNSTTKVVTVAPDAFPCLGVTTPDVSASPVVRLISDPNPPEDAYMVMTVIDDVDSLPAGPKGAAHFSWFLGHGKDPVVYLGRDFPSYTIPAGTFEPGQTARVRVEIHDDVNQKMIADALLSCGDEPRCAAVPGSGCLQRMTWTIDYR